ncbi:MULTISPECIES: PEP-CTERM sorting domain-containing protein [unclassified Alteromonas]|uniref:PEP-CTERM sorting domain-containing protein n=1 Tax=unclassified Alteromonas TaxID=2614992 RepID=UPI000509CBBA|nr:MULTISPECIES: PEP-CTERM sorting domain-containing protein [unclassified Alteromonas]
MKKILASLFLFVTMQANASLISLSVSDNDIDVGETVTVSVLADMTEAFTGFQLQLEFDNTIFEFVDGTFSSDLTPFSDFIFLFGDESYGFSIDFANFLEVSAGEYSVLEIELRGLKSVTGSTIGFGTVAASFIDPNTPDVNIATDTVPALVNVNNAVDVPAPASLGLMAMAIAGLVSVRRKA